MLSVTLGLERHPEPDPEWSEAVHRLAPPSDRLNWLHLGWMAGEPWRPVHRWVVYEMTPAERIRDEDALLRSIGGESLILASLEGPNPRTFGRYDRTRDRFFSDSLITLQQWEMWREFNAFAAPIWIIQGTSGGHKRRFSQSEQQFLLLNGRPHEPPAPGDLPYAPFDGRVVEQLRAHDRLRLWNMKRRLAFTRRNMKDVWQERRAEEQRFNAELLAWLDRQLEDAVRETAGSIDLSDAPRGSDDYERDMAAAERAFIENTETAVPE